MLSAALLLPSNAKGVTNTLVAGTPKAWLTPKSFGICPAEASRSFGSQAWLALALGHSARWLRAILRRPCQAVEAPRSGARAPAPTSSIWLCAPAGTRTRCPSRCSGVRVSENVSLYFHWCNFSRANVKRNKNQTTWAAWAPSPHRGLPQQSGAPRLRQDFLRCQGSNPHFFPEPGTGPTPSVTSSASPLRGCKLRPPAFTAGQRLPRSRCHREAAARAGPGEAKAGVPNKPWRKLIVSWLNS